jgi:hypothetical protein
MYVFFITINVRTTFYFLESGGVDVDKMFGKGNSFFEGSKVEVGRWQLVDGVLFCQVLRGCRLLKGYRR